MALEIYWTKRADKKFDKILDYLHTEWNKNIAKSFIIKVYDFLDILSEFPEIGTLENKEKGIRGFPVIKHINLFYKVKDDKIVILNFFDNRSNPKNKRF